MRGLEWEKKEREQAALLLSEGQLVKSVEWIGFIRKRNMKKKRKEEEEEEEAKRLKKK